MTTLEKIATFVIGFIGMLIIYAIGGEKALEIQIGAMLFVIFCRN